MGVMDAKQKAKRKGAEHELGWFGLSIDFDDLWTTMRYLHAPLIMITFFSTYNNFGPNFLFRSRKNIPI